MIALVDMNAFFASVEQLDKQEWQARPIAITNGHIGTTIITCSYEARSWGVKTGMCFKEAKKLCPDLIQAPSRPERYADFSIRIMESLNSITPDIEVFSIDEAFLDVTGVQHLWGDAYTIGKKIKRVVQNTSGLLCSVGISGDKTTAKYAAKLNKPDGLTVIAPWQAEDILSQVPVTELCGVNTGIGRFLADRGVFVCGDMKKIPASELGGRFGNPGRRIWLMAQGKDPAPLSYIIPPPKTVGHSKVIPPNTKNLDMLLMYFRHISEKVATRLRKHHLKAQKFQLGYGGQRGRVHSREKTMIPINDGAEIFELCKYFLKVYWKREGVFQVHVTALDPNEKRKQLDLFNHENTKTAYLNQAMDSVNERYGEFTLTSARLTNRPELPSVIAPSWRPSGHRQTILPKKRG